MAKLYDLNGTPVPKGIKTRLMCCEVLISEFNGENYVMVATVPSVHTYVTKKSKDRALFSKKAIKVLGGFDAFYKVCKTHKEGLLRMDMIDGLVADPDAGKSLGELILDHINRNNP